MNNCISYEEYLSSFLQGKKYHQSSAFDKPDMVEDPKRGSNAFVNFGVLHRDEFIDYFLKGRSFFLESLPFDLGRFIEVYDQFHETYKAKNKPSRYAVQLKVLYPKSIVDKNKRKTFIKEYIRQLIQVKHEAAYISSKGEKKRKWKPLDLPYVVEEVPHTSKKGKTVIYAVITIVERAYIGVSNYKIYKANKYFDKRTGKWASKNCPDEYKKLKCKKGEYQKTDSGSLKENKTLYLFSKATREFHYAKSKSGRNLFDEFIDMLKQKLLSAFKRISTKKVVKGKVLHKRQNKATYANIVKRRIGMINYAKQTIEYTTNFLLQKEMESSSVLDRFNSEKDPVIKTTEAYKKICSIFEKYRARFKKEEFHDADGNLRKIQHCYQALDELDENVRELIRLFFVDIGRISLS